MKTQQLIVSSFHPFPTIVLTLPTAFPLAALPHLLSPICAPQNASISLLDGSFLPESTLDALPHGTTVRVIPRMLGGKGGFGSQLRAAGGRMSSRKRKGEEDLNSCRDLEGRRLGTVKEARRLEEYLKNLPEREKKKAEDERKRLEDLKKEVQKLEGKIEGDDGTANKKRKLDANELEEGRKRGDKVRSALAMALKKKKPNPTTSIKSKVVKPIITTTESESKSSSSDVSANHSSAEEANNSP